MAPVSELTSLSIDQLHEDSLKLIAAFVEIESSDDRQRVIKLCRELRLHTKRDPL